MKIEVKYAVPK